MTAELSQSASPGWIIAQGSSNGSAFGMLVRISLLTMMLPNLS